MYLLNLSAVGLLKLEATDVASPSQWRSICSYTQTHMQAQSQYPNQFSWTSDPSLKSLSALLWTGATLHQPGTFNKCIFPEIRIWTVHIPVCAGVCQIILLQRLAIEATTSTTGSNKHSQLADCLLDQKQNMTGFVNVQVFPVLSVHFKAPQCFGSLTVCLSFKCSKDNWIKFKSLQPLFCL